MMKPYLLTAALALAAAAPAALAQAETDGTSQAVRTDLWVGSDADGNEARKLALGWDVDHRDIEHCWGVKVEHARFSGRGWRDDQDRVFVSGAGDAGERWRWDGDVGTNGDDLIGRASIHSLDAYRKEFFEPKYDIRDNHNTWLKNGEPISEDHLTAVWQKRVEEYQEPDLTEDRKQILRQLLPERYHSII